MYNIRVEQANWSSDLDGMVIDLRYYNVCQYRERIYSVTNAAYNAIA